MLSVMLLSFARGTCFEWLILEMVAPYWAVRVYALVASARLVSYGVTRQALLSVVRVLRRSAARVYALVVA